MLLGTARTLTIVLLSHGLVDYDYVFGFDLLQGRHCQKMALYKTHLRHLQIKWLDSKLQCLRHLELAALRPRSLFMALLEERHQEH